MKEETRGEVSICYLLGGTVHKPGRTLVRGVRSQVFFSVSALGPLQTLVEMQSSPRPNLVRIRGGDKRNERKRVRGTGWRLILEDPSPLWKTSGGTKAREGKGKVQEYMRERANQTHLTSLSSGRKEQEIDHIRQKQTKDRGEDTERFVTLNLETS